MTDPEYFPEEYHFAPETRSPDKTDDVRYFV